MMDVTFSALAWDHYLERQQLDKKFLRRINELIRDIQRSGPDGGIGKPEPLRHRKGWSRRIDHANRLVYLPGPDGGILIVSCKGHYED